MRKIEKRKLLTFGIFGLACTAVCAALTWSPAEVASAEITEKPTGTATVEIVGEAALESFKMLDGASVRVSAPEGIRFTTEIAAAELQELPDNATFGTLLIPKFVYEREQLTEKTWTTATDKTISLNLAANSWFEKSDENTKYFTGVLTDIPDGYTGKTIMAKSYVTYVDANGEPCTVYATNAQERSIAYVASAALADGRTESFLETCVDDVVSELNVAADSLTIRYEAQNVGATVEYADGAEEQNLVISYSSADPKIAYVNAEGQVFGVSNGATKITAKLGSLTKEVAVTVEKAQANLKQTFNYGDESSVWTYGYGTYSWDGGESYTPTGTLTYDTTNKDRWYLEGFTPEVKEDGWLNISADGEYLTTVGYTAPAAFNGAMHFSFNKEAGDCRIRFVVESGGVQTPTFWDPNSNNGNFVLPVNLNQGDKVYVVFFQEGAESCYGFFDMTVIERADDIYTYTTGSFTWDPVTYNISSTLNVGLNGIYANDTATYNSVTGAFTMNAKQAFGVSYLPTVTGTATITINYVSATEGGKISIRILNADPTNDHYKESPAGGKIENHKVMINVTEGSVIYIAVLSDDDSNVNGTLTYSISEVAAE